MSDNLTHKRPQDGKKISLNEDWEVRYWTGNLNVSHEELRVAIKKVGHNADDVRNYLGR